MLASRVLNGIVCKPDVFLKSLATSSAVVGQTASGDCNAQSYLRLNFIISAEGCLRITLSFDLQKSCGHVRAKQDPKLHFTPLMTAGVLAFCKGAALSGLDWS